jgi:para-aminobenzoate synthetase component 1
MIVDLMRNDLGRVAAPGSVQVADPAELVRFRTVHHLVGHVVGHMDQGAGWVDLVRAAFPPGSITGAPKALAMEVIDELEPVRRSIYTGAIGYVSADGDLDFNVAIRTLLVDRERVTFGVGGAVTARSDPDAEYEETLVKGRALARALGASVDFVEAAPGSGGRATAVIT